MFSVSTKFSLKSKPTLQRQYTATQCSVKVGDKAPNFSLKSQDGKAVSLSKYQGLFGKPVVLFFYGADGSPSCTKEMCAIRDSYSAFKKAGAEVIGISADSTESHSDFADELGLPFTLLTDEGDEVRDEYGIPKDLLFLKGRQTYVINKQGVVELVYNNQFSPETHVDKTLEALA
ncbi:hypothetical protein CYMTET_3632 [Cymbomonas tetramitiformis]|uniref:thioredoxin-dependent peroxiredoxin n=1 Tax=Cymbomonas tetramitiformis TaxID=36881 RepID=A0AAE0H2Y6_9CHLO|nr:hypothetical protein CYMTET_3632 [Cymbomonas tetramitiformis]